VFNQGVIEANLGYRTVKITDELGSRSTAIEFRSIWFENNQYALQVATPGTREVLVEVVPENWSTVSFHDVMFELGHPRDQPDKARAEIPIELRGTKSALVLGCAIGVANSEYPPILINHGCRDTTIVGALLSRGIVDKGTGTTLVGT
jgi:hypothetical protein